MENKTRTIEQHKAVSVPTAKSVMHDFTESKSTTTSPMKVLLLLLLVTVGGIGTGYGLSLVSAKTTTNPLLSNGSVEKGKTYGSADTSTFKDTAEGKLAEGGIAGEGQFHLVRPGGESQNVYVTSSSVDLSQFVNKKIKVWGETQQAQTAGWLMDVGRVEVL